MCISIYTYILCIHMCIYIYIHIIIHYYYHVYYVYIYIYTHTHTAINHGAAQDASSADVVAWLSTMPTVQKIITDVNICCMIIAYVIIIKMT